MSSALMLPGFARALLNRVRARPDTEFQQALIRLVIVVGFILYFSLSALDHSAAINSQILAIGIGSR